jgi:hypothetical protein
MLKLAILFSILIFPFNFMAYKTATSLYHISCFILLIISTFSLLRKGKFSSKTVLLLVAFFGIQFFLAYFFQIAPSNRFLSGLVWFGGLLLVYSQGRFINIDSILIFKSLVSTVSISVFIATIQYHVFNIDRPKAFFNEPSIAGLVFWSMALAVLFILINFKFKPIYTLLLISFLISLIYAGSLTKSTQFLAFLLGLVTLYSLFYYDRISSVVSNKSLLKLFSFAILLILTIFMLINFLDINHLSSRFMFANVTDGTSLSTLSWLRGLDQALAAMNISPLFGLGLGSTGHFNFSSAYSSVLKRQGVGYLNLTDAYSLAFRLVIEIGIVFVCLFAYILFRRLMSFKSFLILSKNSTNFQTVSTQFIFVFSITIIIGCLIKEPLYPQSSLYIAVFILSSVRLKNINKPVYIQTKQEYFL